MYTSAFDKDRFAMVAIYSGPHCDADYAHAMGDLSAMADLANAAGTRATLVVVVEKRAEHPNAVWRQRIAVALRRFVDLRFAFVSESHVARGVSAIIAWLTPSGPRFVRSTHTSFDDAVRALERERGERMAFLHDIHARGRAGMAERAEAHALSA